MLVNNDSKSPNDGSALRFVLKTRVNLLDFPKFGGVRGLDKVKDSRLLSSPYFADIRYVWNTPVLYSYPSMRNEVLNSIRVQSKISELTDAGHGSQSGIADQAKKFYEGIRAAISRVWTRFLGYVMFKIFRRLMSRLLIVPEQLKALKTAHDTGIPLVYLPLHRSHVDYQIITWVVWHFGIRIPHVAAGDNLNLSGFGWLLRATGAFFIKRHIDPSDTSTRDVLYRSVLNSYLLALLKNGQTLEFFLEGTRSRIGKSLLPKNGLISNIVDAVESGELQDLYLVPISVNYDALVEGIFYHELMGVRKPKENLFNVFWGIIESFRQKYVCGTVCVDFETPRLLSEELKAIKASHEAHFGLDYSSNKNSYRELLPWDDRSLQHKTLIRAVGYHVVYSAQRQKPISLSSLISILFLCKYRERVVQMSELIKDVELLIDEVHKLAHEVVGWFVNEMRPEDLILNDIRHLEGALRVNKFAGGEYTIQINDSHKAWITLTYYKNSALSPFTLIAIAAIVSKLKPLNGASSEYVKHFRTLCLFLRYEVLLCSPVESLEERAQQALKFFSGRQNAFDLTFYTHLISPFIETLNYVAEYMLRHPIEYNNVTDTTFIQHLVTEMAADAKLRYKESANSDSVYNSLKALRVWGTVNEIKIELLSEYLIRQFISQLRLFIIEHKVA